MKDLKLRKTILASLLVAMGIVLTSVVSITYPPNNAIIRFGIGFLPLIIIGIMLGPKIGLMSAIIQDIGAYYFYILVFGVPSGPFFPGFTINAILFGVLPGLIYKTHLKDKKVFNYINFFMLVTLLGLAIYALIDLPNIMLTINNQDYNPWVLYLILIIGIFGLISIIYFVIKHIDEEDSSHRIIFSVIILFVITNLILTPIWVEYLYGIPYIAQMPLRIVKTPFEIFIYSILLIRIVKVLNIYMLRD